MALVLALKSLLEAPLSLTVQPLRKENWAKLLGNNERGDGGAGRGLPGP